MAEHGPGPDRSLAVILPALDEADGIRETVRVALSACDELIARGLISRGEVILVDDGSQDGTGVRARDEAGADTRFILVTHPANRGVGAAIRSGIEAASSDLVLYTDADLPVDLVAAAAPALALLDREQAALVAGQRERLGADGWVRRLMTLGYDRLVRIVLGPLPSDVNFAFKLFDRELVRSLGLRSEGPFIDAELVVRLTRSGARVATMPLAYQPRRWGRSSMASVRVVVTIVREMASMVGEIRRLRPEPPHRL